MVLVALGKFTDVPQLDDQEADEYICELRSRGLDAKAAYWPESDPDIVEIRYHGPRSIYRHLLPRLRDRLFSSL